MIGRRGFLARLSAFTALVPGLSKPMLAADAALAAENERRRAMALAERHALSPKAIPWPPTVGQPLTIHQVFPVQGWRTWTLNQVTLVELHHTNHLALASLDPNRMNDSRGRWWWKVGGTNGGNYFSLDFQAGQFHLTEDGVLWFPWGRP